MREPIADDCDVKHCEEQMTLGMTIRYGEIRLEVHLCERHFDILAEWFKENLDA